MFCKSKVAIKSSIRNETEVMEKSPVRRLNQKKKVLGNSEARKDGLILRTKQFHCSTWVPILCLPLKEHCKVTYYATGLTSDTYTPFHPSPEERSNWFSLYCFSGVRKQKINKMARIMSKGQ